MYLNKDRLQNIYYLYLKSKQNGKVSLEKYLSSKYSFSEYQIKRFMKFVRCSPLAAEVENFILYEDKDDSKAE